MAAFSFFSSNSSIHLFLQCKCECVTNNKGRMNPIIINYSIISPGLENARCICVFVFVGMPNVGKYSLFMGKKNGGQTVFVWFPAAERRRMERMKYCGWCGADGDLEQEHTSGYQKMESKQNIAQYRALSRGGP